MSLDFGGLGLEMDMGELLFVYPPSLHVDQHTRMTISVDAAQCQFLRLIGIENL